MNKTLIMFLKQKNVNKSLNVFYRLIFLLILPLYSFAQSTTSESKTATITQGLGFSKITIEYSRPNVKNRKIWGSLVKYGEVWRTGANYPTLITMSDTTFIENKLILPGKYAIYTIPNLKEWTIIFSENTNLWGAFGYNEKDDFIRIKTEPQVAEFTETMTFGFEDVKGNKAMLFLKWENLKIPLRVSVDVYDEIIENVKNKSNIGKADWATYNFAADYMLRHNIHLDLVEQWINESLRLEKNWMNLWTNSMLLHNNKKIKQAIKYGEMALEECNKNIEYCFYNEYYKNQISKWKFELKKINKI